MPFDAFLSYHRNDAAAVEAVALSLKARGLVVWFDKWQLQPGLEWGSGAEQALEECGSTVFFLGPTGMGDWQQGELRVSLEHYRKKKKPVIPVLLPGVDAKTASDLLPAFASIHTWVDMNLNEVEALDRLVWGITGKNPYISSSPSASVVGSVIDTSANDVNEAVADLVRSFADDNVSLFIGRDVYPNAPSLPPSPRELACRLLDDVFSEPTGTQPGFLPPPDIAATYFAAKNGEPRLDRTVEDLIVERSSSIPTFYDELANLLVSLSKRPVRRGRKRQCQVVITTNLDILLERALLSAGISFTRIVHNRAQGNLTIAEFGKVELTQDGSILVDGTDGMRKAAANNSDAIDSLIMSQQSRRVGVDGDLTAVRSLQLSALSQPILYKFLGSADIASSCTLSTDQYFERVLRRDWIPDQISAVLAATPMLFFGCRTLDPDFRLMYHTLLHPALVINQYHQYAVLPLATNSSTDYDLQIQMRIWRRLKEEALRRYRVALIEESPERFVRRLRESLKS